MDTTIRTDDGLAEALENTRLGDEHQEPEHLLFRPRENSGLPGAALDNVPRYLFRVASPNSDGETDENWVRSESAKENCPSSREDIFSELSDSKRGDVAQILNLHLRWSVKCEWVRWFKDGKLEDNFMSWTSSLLFALQYIYYRHLGARDESSLDEIKLYVIDTTRFPRGTFLRDLDLIHAFHQFDYPPERNLTALQSLRNSGYYFGEYLSQGSLKIANKCQVVPGARFFDDSRLCRLQPDFNKLNSLAPTNGKLEWAKEVRRLRICIWGGPGLPLLSSAELCNRLQAIEEIVRDVAPDWKYPLAVNLAALMGVETVTADHDTANDNVFFEYFRSEFFNGKLAGIPPRPYDTTTDSEWLLQ